MAGLPVHTQSTEPDEQAQLKAIELCIVFRRAFLSTEYAHRPEAYIFLCTKSLAGSIPTGRYILFVCNCCR